MQISLTVRELTYIMPNEEYSCFRGNEWADKVELPIEFVL